MSEAQRGAQSVLWAMPESRAFKPEFSVNRRLIMKLFKRNKTWWADFSVNGQRFRVSLDTTDKRKAVSEADDRLVKAKQGKLSTASQSFARLAFPEAAEKYLSGRKLELAPASL